MTCPHCHNGYLERGDVECVNGVLIDIDVAHEGWQRDVAYPPAPCVACDKCGGSGERGRGQCRACRGTGWKSGRNESQDRLMEWGAPEPSVASAPIGPATQTLLRELASQVNLLTADESGYSPIDRVLTAAEAEWSATDADERD